MAWYIGAQQSYDDVSSEITFKWPFSEEEVVVIDITFAYSGTAVFYTTGSGLDDSGNVYDTYGFLRESAEDVDGYTGFPEGDGMSSDDDGNDYNFRIEYDVEADRTYYLYVRHHSAVSYGDITVKIVPPEGGGDEYYQPSYDNINVDVSAGDSSVTVHVSGFDTAYDDVWRVTYGVTEKETGTNIVNLTLRSDNDLSFNNVTFDSSDGILPGTTYQVLIMIVPYPDVDSGCDSWITWTPYEVTTGGEDHDESGAKLNLFSSEDGRTITAYVSGLDTSYSRNDRYIVWSLDGDPLDEEMDVDAGDSSSGTVTWTDLSPGKTYTVGAAIWYTTNGEYQSKYLSDDITTNAPERPAKFSWTYDKTKGEPFNLTAQEWCDLLDNINAVRVYKGHSEFTKGSYTETYYYNYFTYPSSGDIFRYQHYNQALNAITGILGDGYRENEVQSGWPVTADCLNLLVEMINSVE